MTAKKSGAHSGGGGGESAHAGLSLREFARQIGVSESAVRKAVAAGRLQKSIGKTSKNKPFVLDLVVARLEWTSTSRTSTGVRTEVRTAPPSGAQASPEPPPPAQASAEPEEPDAEATGQLVFGRTLIDAQTLATNERARKLKFENDVTEGRLIPIEKVTKEAFEAERIVRETMLNLVARVGGELHAERDLKRFLIKFETYIHQGLNQTADALLAVNE